MDTKALHCFLQVCQSGSLSKAAQHLHISQQGPGTILDRLEKELGFKLFRRDARGMHLTMEGRYFLPHAQKIMETADAASRTSVQDKTNVSPAGGLHLWCIQCLCGAIPAGISGPTSRGADGDDGISGCLV